MNPSELKNSQDRSRPYPRETIAQVYTQIRRACVLAGLSLSDAEDVAQDIWEWLLRDGNLTLVGTAPWMSAVARNFILRYWRRRRGRDYREGAELENAPDLPSSEEINRLERTEVLERVAGVLPRTERKLLALIRSGYTPAEAARMLGIPRGSRHYFHDQLIAYARRVLRRDSTVPPSGHKAKM